MRALQSLVPASYTPYRLLQDQPTCSFNALIALECSLDDYCSTLRSANPDDAEETDITCGGDPADDWFVAYESSQNCYNTPGDVPTTENEIDPVTGYCSRFAEYRNFTQGALTKVENRETITFPPIKSGVLRSLREVAECVGQGAPEYEFGEVEFCVPECYDFVIEDEPCLFECLECNDGFVAPNCTNVSPELAALHCSPNDAIYYGKIFDYFSGLREEDESEEPFEEDEPTASPETPPPSTAPVTFSPSAAPIAATIQPIPSPATALPVSTPLDVASTTPTTVRETASPTQAPMAITEPDSTMSPVATPVDPSTASPVMEESSSTDTPVSLPATTEAPVMSEPQATAAPAMREPQATDSPVASPVASEGSVTTSSSSIVVSSLAAVCLVVVTAM